MINLIRVFEKYPDVQVSFKYDAELNAIEVILSKENKEVSHLIPREVVESSLTNMVEDRVMRLCEALEDFDDPAEEESSKVIIEIDVNKDFEGIEIEQAIQNTEGLAQRILMVIHHKWVTIIGHPEWSYLTGKREIKRDTNPMNRLFGVE